MKHRSQRVVREKEVGASIATRHQEVADEDAQVCGVRTDLAQLLEILNDLNDSGFVLTYLRVKLGLDRPLLLLNRCQLLLSRLDALVPVLLHHDQLVLQFFDLSLEGLALALDFGL